MLPVDFCGMYKIKYLTLHDIHISHCVTVPSVRLFPAFYSVVDLFYAQCCGSSSGPHIALSPPSSRQFFFNPVLSQMAFPINPVDIAA
jgi:hypothetical protein